MFPRLRLLLGVVLASSHAAPALAAKGGQLEISVVDRDTGRPLAARMHLKYAAGRPVKAPPAPFWHDHFVFDGQLTLKLPVGNYSFEIECGPEYLLRTGQFTISDFASDAKVVDMKRFVDMAKEGWWSGDLNVLRPAKDIELLMKADDLHVAHVAAWGSIKAASFMPAASGNAGSAGPLVQFDGNRWCHLSAGVDSRSGGTLLLLNMSQPLDLNKLAPELPPMLNTIAQAREHGPVWIDVPRAASWDLPVWLAAAKVDSIELAGGNLCHNSVIATEPNTRPRDMTRFPGNDGVGRWPAAVYYHALDCGFKLPPTAGSGSGESPNPVGYNRVYVHVGDEPTYEAWWENLRAGRVVVTNGPMIRPTVEGELPGHTFRADKGQEVELEIGLTLSTRERIDYLEVVKNGRVAQTARLDDWAKAGGRLAPLRFTESGWFVVRAVTNLQQTYRFASTGPYYVEIGYQPRISRESAQFFLDWVTERARGLKLDDPAGREQALVPLRAARDFWQALVAKANAE